MSLRTNPVLRFFSSDKLIESRLLNRMGAQVARTVAARWLYNRPSGRADPSIQEVVNMLRRDGIVVIPNFLTPDHFEGVRQECMELLKKPDQVTKENSVRFGPGFRQFIENCCWRKQQPEDYPG